MSQYHKKNRLDNVIWFSIFEIWGSLAYHQVTALRVGIIEAMMQLWDIPAKELENRRVVIYVKNATAFHLGTVPEQLPP